MERESSSRGSTHVEQVEDMAMADECTLLTPNKFANVVCLLNFLDGISVIVVQEFCGGRRSL